MESTRGSVETGTGSEPTLTPYEDAADLACAALDATAAIELPAPGQGAGFAFSDYPVRFVLDFSQAEAPVFDGNVWCHRFGAEFDCLGCACPLNDCRTWPDPDGEIRIYMATRGIEHVEFYGSDTPIPPEPYAPLTPSIRYDVGDRCPDLPVVWTPDPELAPYRSIYRVCMRHADDLAEVVFVRTP